MKPLKDRPVYSVKDFGAKDDGVTNDTQALQKALDDTPSGAVLKFPEGIYLYDTSLKLSKNGTILMGKGGILRATNPDNQTLEITGYTSAIVDMIFHGTGNKRTGKPKTTKIWLKGRWNQILNNTIDGGAGIFVFNAKDFRIAGNKVQNTLADGIHMTKGSRRGIVEYNHVQGKGDDPIAVVSYQNKNRPGKLSGDIIIRNNNVSDVSHGRGITVVGGENVLIEHNAVSDIETAAGILIAQEASYNTFGVNNIIVRHNTLQNIQLPPILKWSHHAAIDINSSNQKHVENIQILDNVIQGARFSGVRVLGEVCNVNVSGNAFSSIQHKKAFNIKKSSCALDKIICSNNKLDGSILKQNAERCTADIKAVSFPTYDFEQLEQNNWGGCP